mmetsp:Transcript_7420/g.17325  ORF Transcript_7420/g.17325 Transcript_7420/m.17325 type:complete len:272 (-) Transcript_7420:51-866(-)
MRAARRGGGGPLERGGARPRGGVRRICRGKAPGAGGSGIPGGPSVGSAGGHILRERLKEAPLELGEQLGVAVGVVQVAVGARAHKGVDGDAIRGAEDERLCNVHLQVAQDAADGGERRQTVAEDGVQFGVHVTPPRLLPLHHEPPAIMHLLLQQQPLYEGGVLRAVLCRGRARVLVGKPRHERLHRRRRGLARVRALLRHARLRHLDRAAPKTFRQGTISPGICAATFAHCLQALPGARAWRRLSRCSAAALFVQLSRSGSVPVAPTVLTA